MTDQTPYRYVDLSGYAFTGKQAVIDLMREFGGYHVPHFAFEFNLLRIQGGLLDLESALSTDWSPIRADAAVRRFRRLVTRLGSKNRLTDPRSWFTAVGWNWDLYFNNRFFELSNRYIDRLVQVTWKADWPYPMAEISNLELFWRKLKGRMGIKGAYDFEVCLACTGEFVELTKRYLNELLSSNVGPDIRTIVMHNAFEPFQPQRCLKFFDRVKCIVVDRDPRDNYVQQLTYPPIALPAPEFIKRYRLQREMSKKFLVDHPDILRIRFEDLVLNYDEMLPRILRHLGEDASVHLRKKMYFDPSVSVKNVGLWKGHPRQEEIEKIREELKEYCYD